MVRLCNPRPPVVRSDCRVEDKLFSPGQEKALRPNRLPSPIGKTGKVSLIVVSRFSMLAAAPAVSLASCLQTAFLSSVDLHDHPILNGYQYGSKPEVLDRIKNLIRR